VQYVRKNDNDEFVLDLTEGIVEGNRGHWMGGNSEVKASPIDKVVPADWGVVTTDQLFSRWFDPGAWLKAGRAVVVRPGDEENPSVPHLCQSATMALQEGCDLVLVVGDLISFRLPNYTLFIAGIILRDNRMVAFIIPEKAARRDRCFTGKVKGHQSGGDRGLPWFEAGMYAWEQNDIYDYREGAWS
jgi:hypothetical protein